MLVQDSIPPEPRLKEHVIYKDKKNKVHFAPSWVWWRDIIEPLGGYELLGKVFAYDGPSALNKWKRGEE